MIEPKDWLPVIAAVLALAVALINLIIARVSANTSKANGVNIAHLTAIVKDAQSALAESGNQTMAIATKLIDIINKHFRRGP